MPCCNSNCKHNWGPVYAKTMENGDIVEYVVYYLCILCGVKQ